MQGQPANRNEEYDVIVVGAGLGGSILAARLAQFGVNPRNGEKLKIALFEYGPYHKGDPRRGYGIASRRGAFDGMPYELARRYMLPWGTLGLVGGATQWAGMIAHPPVEIDFEHWRTETGVDWTWEKFSNPLNEVREMWHPYPEPEEVRTPGQQRFRQAALALGYDVHEMGQAKVNCVRCGDCNGRFCRYDAKSTPLVTYIPITEREGVRIFGNTPVEKVLIEKKGSRPVATGVLYHQSGDLRQALAGKVIVSCGYNGTPRLLYRSGYGPWDKVQGELLAENRNVGSNLVSSLNTGNIFMLFDEPIKHPDMGVHSVYYVQTVGPRGYNLLMVAESLGDREGTRTFPEDFVTSVLAPEFGRDLKQFMKLALTHVGNLRIEMSKTKVRGEISPQGLALFGGVTEEARGGGVTKEYLAKNYPETLEYMAGGQEIARKIITEMGPKKVVGGEKLPERFPTNHSHGSCRAGASRENSVVNSDFESHDVDNLLICDASVMPVQCTANPSMPTATICSYAWRRMITKHFLRA